jgi:GR25 family glycosyltransferase involved in LPS biosynthesis
VPHRANWTLLDPSKPIKVINLDRSVERWLAIQEQFRKFPQIAYERFAAVEGSDISQNISHKLPAYPIHDAKSRVNLDRQARLRSGEIGVYLSNLELWYALVRDVHNDYYMILEDDVILNEGFQAPNAYVRAAPVDWDVIFVGYNIHYCKLPHTTLRFVRLDYRCMPGHFGYIIRKRAAQYYLNFALPIEVGIDEFQRMQAKNLNLYVLTSPGVSTDYYNASTIERSPGL